MNYSVRSTRPSPPLRPAARDGAAAPRPRRGTQPVGRLPGLRAPPRVVAHPLGRVLRPQIWQPPALAMRRGAGGHQCRHRRRAAGGGRRRRRAGDARPHQFRGRALERAQVPDPRRPVPARAARSRGDASGRGCRSFAQIK